ncbi:hypothetical protein EC845_3059 [Comamonas sp. BIGb0124]|uniref:hypothetical protein n=1 Tax=Comamonas sp. BIGb0124 TaxID=2485130 RepID=UPI000F4909BA|nr:hypothetical protein [Comamonas sp. BIGb0124]ROR20240.1 hypothetical protein EC845_3059 [Comamonas sp. BIGb0124]
MTATLTPPLRRVWRVLPALLLVGLLQACGGGGGSGDGGAGTGSEAGNGAGNGNGSSANYFDEFFGTWKTTASSECWQADDAGAVFVRDAFAVTLSETSASILSYAYTDSACKLDETTISLNFDLTHSPVTVAGRSNVIRADLTFKDATATRNGETVPVPLTMAQLEELDLVQAGKDLADVDGDRLYFGNDDALDADGYPTTIDTGDYLVR